MRVQVQKDGKKEAVEVKSGVWVQRIPYSVVQNVFYRTEDGEVGFGYVASMYRTDSDGNIKEVYTDNQCRRINEWMPIAFPFKERQGWHSEYWGDDEEPEDGEKCVVCFKSKLHRNYRMGVDWYKEKGKYSDWELKDHKENCSEVVAWRKFPK